MSIAAPMPAGVAPMLATAGPLPGDDDEFGFEIKWDGVRALARVADGCLCLFSRKLVDITARYPELWLPAGSALESMRRTLILDGEVVAFDEQSRPNFGRLQHRMHVADSREAARRAERYPVSLMLFDLLWLDGRSIMDLPYAERRRLLDSLELDHSYWAVPRHHVGDGSALLEATAARGLEGVVAKRLTSVYEPGRRSRSWIKVKLKPRQDVVIGGWVPGSGNRSGRIGALLAGYYEGGKLRFAGRVGTGFTEKVLDDLGRLLTGLERTTSPFADAVPYREARFVEPQLVAEVELTEWTAGNTMRHPSYKGLRDDKVPGEVLREPVGGAGPDRPPPISRPRRPNRHE